MIIENLSVLKIHKLSAEQLKRLVESGDYDKTAIYLTPDEETTDLTLSISGVAADAAATGEAISQKSQVSIIEWGDDD